MLLLLRSLLLLMHLSCHAWTLQMSHQQQMLKQAQPQQQPQQRTRAHLRL
jgi:hypothetical protein